MTRPSSPEDIEEYYRRGHRVAEIPSDYITRYPSLGMHLLSAIAESERLGLQVDNGEITIPLTAEELDSKVKSAQRSWDTGKEMHDKYLTDGEWPKYYYLWDTYLKTEGIERPQKPEETA